MTDQPYNAGEERAVSERKNKAKFDRDSELIELREILNTYGGRRFLWRLLCECNLYKTSFTGNSTTFFNEGARNIGLWTLAEIEEADMDAYTLMKKEARERESGIPSTTKGRK